MSDKISLTEEELNKQKAVFNETVKVLDYIEEEIKNAASDAELTAREDELKNADTRLNQLLSVMPEVPRSDFAEPIQKDFREVINAILSESVRIIHLEAKLKNAKTEPIPLSDDLDCTNAEIMMYALRNLGFYAEIAEYEAPGFCRYGTYNPAPVLLTNANTDEVMTLFPDWDTFNENDEDAYWSLYDPVGSDYERCGVDGWTWPIFSEETAPHTLRYYFPEGVVSHDDWIQIKTGQPVRYTGNEVICFYSHTNGLYQPFSNFYYSEMGNKEKHASVEHYFQTMKALEFDPEGEAKKQMGNHLTCREIKALGRKVQNFNPAIWNIRSRFHMRDAIFMKFSQNEQLEELLLSTKDAILAEASPRDVLWGIGYSENNPKAYDPSQWRGKNVLGNILMYTREYMRYLGCVSEDQ